jgi:hypothetical protein
MAEKTHTWLYLVLGGSLGLLLATIWSFHYLPLTDLPEHVLASKVLVDYEDPGTCYSSFYTVETPWKPYSATFFWSARLLAPVVTPLHAAKLYLSLSLVLTIVGIGVWLKAVAPGQMVQLIPATMLLYSSFFFVGMLNTLFAVPFFFFALWSCHEILKKGRTSPFYDVGLAVCLLLIYFSHITVFGAAILVLGTLWLFSPNRRRGWRLALAAAPSVGLTLAYFLLTTSKGVHTLLNISYDPILLRASSLLVPFNAVFDRVNHVWVYEPDQLVIDILLGILIVLGTVVGSRRSAFRSEGVVSKRHVVVVALSLLGSTLLLPSLVGGALSIGIRLGYFATLVLLMLAPTGWSRSPALRAGVVILALAMPLLFAYHCYLFQGEMGDFERIVDRMPSCQVVLPIVTELNGAGLHNYPHLHDADWYCYLKGGINPYTITRFPYFPVQARCKFFPAAPGEFSMASFKYARNEKGVQYFLARTRETGIIDDLKAHVPLLARGGLWWVFGPNRGTRVNCGE